MAHCEGTRSMTTGVRSRFSRLTEQIAHERGGNHASRIARTICRHTDGGIAFLGLMTGGEAALFFDPRYQRVYVAPVSPIGVHVSAAHIHDAVITNPVDGIAHADAALAFINPMYRPHSPEFVEK